MGHSTICPGSSDPYYVKWVSTSWTHSRFTINWFIYRVTTLSCPKESRYATQRYWDFGQDILDTLYLVFRLNFLKLREFISLCSAKCIPRSTDMRWQLRRRCACVPWIWQFDLFQAFLYIDSKIGHEIFIFQGWHLHGPMVLLLTI